MELDPVIVAAIEAHLSRPDRYQAIITTIAKKVHNNKELFDIYRAYLDDRFIQIIQGKTKAKQIEILEPYRLPMVYVNQLIARTNEAAAPAAAIENENLGAAEMLQVARNASLLQALRKGGKSRRRKSHRQRRPSRCAERRPEGASYRRKSHRRR
jgi:hypothetical protein